MRHSLAHSAPTNPVTLTESHSQCAKMCTSNKASIYQPHPTSPQVGIFNMPHISVKALILFSLQHFIAPFFNFLRLLQSLVPRACKQGSKSKAGAIKCCKVNKITSPPNAWHNIPFMTPNNPHCHPSFCQQNIRHSIFSTQILSFEFKGSNIILQY